MRGRCRGLVIPLLVGVVVTTVNLALLWTQLPSQHCVCDLNLNPTRSVYGSVRMDAGTNSLTRTNGTNAISYELNSPKNWNGTETAVTPVTTSEDAPLSPLRAEEPGEPVEQRDKGYGPHQLAVVVPFRDRFEEMLEFAPHIHQFLERQKVRHQIWIINQADSHRFNRASLLNIGFLLSRNECDYMVMHDIDLLPLNDDLRYDYPAEGPFHVSSPELHPLYHYKTFVGGVLMLTREQFEKVNGLSNLFWGWGREDDELYIRMKEARMKVHYPQGITTGYNTFRHIHDREKRPRDQKRLYNQWEVSKKRDRVTGVNTVKYSVTSTVEMTIAGAPLHFVSVELECDYNSTPFCDNPS